MQSLQRTIFLFSIVTMEQNLLSLDNPVERILPCTWIWSCGVHLGGYRFFAGGPFWATAAFTSALNARASTCSPS